MGLPTLKAPQAPPPAPPALPPAPLALRPALQVHLLALQVPQAHPPHHQSSTMRVLPMLPHHIHHLLHHHPAVPATTDGRSCRSPSGPTRARARALSSLAGAPLQRARGQLSGLASL